MHIGYDIDGVLTSKDPTHISRVGIRLLVGISHRFFPKIIKNWTLTRALQVDIKIARDIAKDHHISIITARPQEFYNYTEQWLKTVAKIDYDNLYCVGLKSNFEQRKLDIAKEVKIDLFLDDTQSTIDLFEKNGIKAHFFKSWSEVKDYLKI